MWKTEFFRTSELTMIAQIPFFNAVGNHESNGTNTDAFLCGLSALSGTERYYSLDYGDLHVVVVNNLVSYGEGSTQYNFVKNDLLNSSKRWKIVISHYPAYCAGGHGEDPSMITMAQKAFEPAGVDMLLSGHSHFINTTRWATFTM